MQGRLIIVEDAGGAVGSVNNFARRPNSYIYRFILVNPSDLTRSGKLQLLQVQSIPHSGPIYSNDFATAEAQILAG